MNNEKFKISGIVFLFLSLICLFAGISYSIFTFFGNGSTNNVIQTGRIVFSYSDANGGGNGINIEDATPISDEQGKILSGIGEYFDFSVFATTTNTDIVYEITASKDSSSTLDDRWVKIYLTEFSGDSEVVTDITNNNGNITTYDMLSDTTNSLLSGKTIYFGTVKSGEVAYSKKFRLRMWIKDPSDVNFDYSEINGKYFSLKVDVAATSSY